MTTIDAKLSDLATLYRNSTAGTWQRGRTSHHTVTEKGYAIGEFHHACDAAFCDAAHDLVPTLLAEFAALRAALTEAQTVPPTDFSAVVAYRYRLAGDLQWQYTERKEQAPPRSEVQNLVIAAQPTERKAPHECKTEGEKTAFAFGWWKALESVRGKVQPADLSARLADLHLYEEIAEHYAKCEISPGALRDWVADRTAIAQPVQPAAAWHPTEAAIAALKRFEETCSDGEGYDVPKDTMRILVAIGLIYKTHGATYRITDFGRHILEAPIAQPVPQKETE